MSGDDDSEWTDPSSESGEAHNIEIAGIWHNDDTAGVWVYCNTCNEILISGDRHGDRLTPKQVAGAVEAHRAAQVAPSRVPGAGGEED